MRDQYHINEVVDAIDSLLVPMAEGELPEDEYSLDQLTELLRACKKLSDHIRNQFLK